MCHTSERKITRPKMKEVQLRQVSQPIDDNTGEKQDEERAFDLETHRGNQRQRTEPKAQEKK